MDIERKSVKRLDQALTIWEQACFRLNTRTRIQIGVGMPVTTPLGEPLLQYSQFRRHLLRSNEEGHKFDTDRFLGTDLAIQTTLGAIGAIPESLYEWGKHSRRIFRLSDDLSGQLLATDLDGILWSDVRFPFSAYGMDLETPLEIGNSPATDFIMVNEVNIPSGKGIALSMLPNLFDDISQLTNKEIQFFTDMLTQRRWHRAYNKFRELDARGPSIPQYPFLVIEKNKLDFPVTDSETIINRLGLTPTTDEKEVLKQATRLVVGFCLYLKQIPIGGKFQSEWTPVPSSPDPTAITNEAEVCYITSTHPLVGKIRNGTPGEEGRGEYEMPWHQRRGYWSRERGKGNDPTAPKIIWHAPTEVRRDRKPIGDSIPGGAQTNA